MDINLYYKKAKKLLFLLAMLMLLDYLITYFGLHILQCVIEANPLMIKFMNLPFYIGLPIRFIMIILPISLLWLAYYLFDNKKRFITILRFMFIIEIVPFVFHGFWIYSYLT